MLGGLGFFFEESNVYLVYLVCITPTVAPVLLSALKSYTKIKPSFHAVASSVQNQSSVAILGHDFISTALKRCGFLKGLGYQGACFQQCPVSQRMHAYREDLTHLLMQQIYVPALPPPPLK